MIKAAVVENVKSSENIMKQKVNRTSEQEGEFENNSVNRKTERWSKNFINKLGF